LKFRLTGILILIVIMGRLSFAQQAELNPYFPSQVRQTDWKTRVDIWGSEDSRSNSFTNNFFNDVTSSGYLDPGLKNEQIDKLHGDVLTGTLRSVGGGVFMNSKKVFYYIGVEHQHILDSRIDDNLIKLLLLGNKPFAGSTLNIGNSNYTSIYINRLLGGVGYALQQENKTHTFFGKLGFTSGQNYDNINVDHASLYTHPDGDFLDMTVNASTKLSDTVWADLFDINGLGLSLDLSYAFQKKNEYYLSLSAKNLGFINWNSNTFSAQIDTSFRFEGVNMDTTAGSNEEIPDDYSYNNLRRVLFKNPDGSPFTTSLPVILNLKAGKYFAGDQFYTGINFYFYPTLEAGYHLELFGTWNYNHIFQLTPIFSYSSYNKINVGLGVGVKLSDNVYIRAGTAYLDSFFDGSSPAGRGGFVRLVYIR